MASELKTLHPYLYRRVRIKGLLFTTLGLSSIFSVYLDPLVHAQSRASSQAGLSPIYSGSIFLAIGLFILITLYGSPKGYLKSRIGLYLALIYALFWEFVLLGLVISKSISTLSIFILWGYLTYNLALISRDSAWDGAELVREIKEE